MFNSLFRLIDRTFLNFSKLLIVLLLLIVHDVNADSQYSGSWYNPERDGEGFHIEILDNNQALVIWFTFPGDTDPAQAEQAWILGTGAVDGEFIIIQDAFKVRGPVFGEAYNPDDRITDDWGEITIQFYDQNSGIVGYDGKDGSGATEIVRITSLIEPEDTGGLPPGISGAWYNPETDGQGWFVEIISKTQALVYWFTYDENGNQAWNLGVGDIIGHSIIVRDSQSGKNTQFGSVFNSGDVVRETFAGFTLNFSSCYDGDILYVTASGARTGSLPITRITELEGAICEGLPQPEDGQITVMSNPSDPVLKRYTTPDGTMFDLFGLADETGAIESVSGGIATMPNGENVRLRFDSDNQRYEITESESGISFVISMDEDGNISLTASEPTTDSSITIPLPNAGPQQVQADQRLKSGTSVSELKAIEQPGTPDGSAKTGSVVVSQCSDLTSTNQASVDFKFVELDWVVPAYPRQLMDGSYVYEGNIPRDMPPVATPVTDFLCTATHPDIANFCNALGPGGAAIQTAQACGLLAASFAASGIAWPFAPAIATSCAVTLGAVLGACAADDVRSALCNAPEAAKAVRIWDGLDQDAYATAKLGNGAYKYTPYISLDKDAGSYKFPDIKFNQPSSVLKVDTYPKNPIEGGVYQLDVQTSCMEAGTQLLFKRENGPDAECTVNSLGQCLFTIDTSEGAITDKGVIQGQPGINKTVVTTLVPLTDAAPIPLVSPKSGSSVANKCGDDDPVWKFEWSPVDGASSYTVRLLDGDDNEVFNRKANGTTFSYTLTQKIAEDKRQDWLWEVRSEPDGPWAGAEFEVEKCETLDLSGSWRWTETIGNNTCEDPQATETFDVSMTQNGISVAVCEEGWGCLNGELNGNSVSWAGSVAEHGGTTTGRLTGSVSSSGNLITGSGTYDWVEGDYSCSGVFTFSATRN